MIGLRTFAARAYSLPRLSGASRHRGDLAETDHIILQGPDGFVTSVFVILYPKAATVTE